MKNNTLPVILLLCIMATTEAFSQIQPPIYHETKGSNPIPVNPAHRRTSPPYTIQGSGFFSTQVNVDANGNNILGDAANEPSIAIDPTNPLRMAIGWRQFDTIASDFRQAGQGYTNDGGLTWTFPGVIDPGVFRSDPVLDSDSEGRFYYNSLTLDSEYSCNVFRSTGDGTWDEGPYAFGGDKQWMVIDKTGGIGDGNIYANWNSVFSVCPPGDFTRSTNGGDTYENCSNVANAPYWGNMSIGPAGELYAVGYGGEVSKSTNAKNAGESVTWTESYFTLNGFLGSFDNFSPNPGGLLGQIWVATDHSNGPTHGNVYVLATIIPATGSDPLDTYFNSSSNGGTTWGTPVRVNDDLNDTNWQWFGTMSVAPNGRIDAVWLDTRDNPWTYLSSLYYSYSENGGLTWSPNERLSDAFDPHLGWPIQQKMGDYFHMISDNEGAHLAWAATFNGEQDVYYGRITVNTTPTTATENPSGATVSCFPNPFSSNTKFVVDLKAPNEVSLAIYHQTGQLARVLVDREPWNQGTNTLAFDGKDGLGNELPAGIYFYKLQVEGLPSTLGKLVLQ